MSKKKVDSDVVILCLTYADVLISNWIESFLVVFGTKDKKIDIVDNFKKFGVSACKIFEFFHAFTGCDTISSFYIVGKDKFWAVSLARVKAGDTALSKIFKKLSNCPINIEGNEFDTLYNLTYGVYGLTKQAPFKTRCTDHLIFTPNVNLWMQVPSTSGILQHIKWACIQAGYFWKLSGIEINIPDPVGLETIPWQLIRTTLRRQGCRR